MAKWNHGRQFNLRLVVQSPGRSDHARSSGPASLPVMGGVRRQRNQIIHLLCVAGRPMKPLSSGDSILTTINRMEGGSALSFGHTC